MIITRMTKQRAVLGELTAAQTNALCDPTHHPSDVADLLEDLYRLQHWIFCPCGWTFHARAGVTLARNSGQPEPKVEPCALCQSWPYQPGVRKPREEGEDRPTQRGLSLIATGRRRTGSGVPGPVLRVGGRRTTMKYASMFRALWTLMEDAGFLSLGGPLTEEERWRRLAEASALAPLFEKEDALTFADLVWTPESASTPDEMLTRLEGAWRDRKVKPQVWLMAILPGLPKAEGDHLRFVISGRFGQVDVELPAGNQSVVGRRGPQLVLVQATRGRQGDLRFDKIAAQAVLSAGCPLPVDSDYERDVAKLIQELGISLYKPCYAYVDDLTPDLMLLDFQVLVEVQGMRKADYSERKRRVHERMRTHPALRGWKLLTYNPHQETLQEFKNKLRQWWRGGKGGGASTA